MINFQYQSQLNSSTLQKRDIVCYKDVELSTKYGKKYGHLCNKFYHLFVMLMNLIGLVIENSSYNWSIITHRHPNTNSVDVFYCIKFINGNGNGIFHNCANTLIVQ